MNQVAFCGWRPRNIFTTACFRSVGLFSSSRARVVPKDELLDALWPGITVTEGSLQRAVSMLRGALREGGMESAVRSFPRVGYRLCLEAEPLETERSEAQTQIFSQTVVTAQQAITEQRWVDAVESYAKVSDGNR